MIDQAVYTLLSGAVGAGVAVVPVSDTVASGLPKVIYNLISGPRTYNDSGTDGIVSARYQLDIFAPTMLAAATLAELILSVLDNHNGTTAGHQILHISFPDSPTNHRAETVAGQNFTAARVSLDMVVTHRP